MVQSPDDDNENEAVAEALTPFFSVVVQQSAICSAVLRKLVGYCEADVEILRSNRQKFL